MRCAMDSSSSTNSMSPRLPSSLPAMDFRPLCIDEMMTTNATSTATSSSSPSCSSRAAATSSFATTKLTETERSAPSEFRAAEASIAATFRSPLARAPSLGSRVAPSVLARAAASYTTLDPSLLSPQVEAKSIPLCLLFLAPVKAPAVESGRKRRSPIAAAASLAVPVEGAVYGTFLGSLVQTLSVRGVTTSFCVRSIRAALLPVAAAARQVDGVDGRVLCAGLAASRTVRDQMAYFGTARAPPSLHSSIGHPTIILGATATIYVLFTLLASDRFGSVDASALAEHTTSMLENDLVASTFDYAGVLMERAVPPDATWMGAPPLETLAVDVEARACARAALGARTAAAFGRTRCLDAVQTMRLVLSWSSRAAWPAGELVNERTHDALLAQMRTSAFFERPVAAPSAERAAAAAGAVVPLSQLTDRSCGSCVPRRGGSVASSSVGSSSVGSSVGSVGSVGSSVVGEEDDAASVVAAVAGAMRLMGDG